MPLVNFQETLKQLGSDDFERGKALGVSERTIRLWRAKEPRIIRLIVANLALARALAEDAETCNRPSGEPQISA